MTYRAEQPQPAASDPSRRPRLSRRLGGLVSVSLIASLTVFSVTAPTPAAGAAGQPSAEMAVTVAGVPIRDESVVDDGTTVNVGVSGLLTPGTSDRELRASLDPGMKFTAGGAQAPEGWTIEYSSDDGETWSPVEPDPASTVTDVRAVKSVTAGAIAGYSQLYSSSTVAAIPSSTFSGSTGGDGWDVFFSDDFVFNIFHHSDNIVLDCHSRTTGARCEGYTTTFAGYGASMRSGGWVDTITGKLYAFTQESASGQPGVLCIDITGMPSSCGFTALSTDTDVNSWSYLTEADSIGRRLFGVETSGAPSLLCYDAALDAACPNSPVELEGAGAYELTHPVKVGSKIMVKTSDWIYCFDSSTVTPCAGTWPVAIDGYTYTPIAPHTDAEGTIDGVCDQNGCFDLSGSATDWTTPYSLGTSGWAIYATSGAMTQGRFYYVGDDVTGVECFDYATDAGCANFPLHYDDTGLVYTIRADPNNPSCMWINSDGGQIRVFDAFSGLAECTANPVITLQPSSFAPRFTCSTTDSIDEWKTLSLASFGGTGTPASVALTVRNAVGDVVSGWSNRAVTIGQTLDMTGLDVTQSGSRPTFSFAFGGVTGGTISSATIDLNYSGKGPELCVRALLDSNQALCPVLTGLDGSLVEGTVPPATFTVRRQFTIGTDPSTCPENIVEQTVPSVPRSLTGSGFNGDALLRFLPPIDDGGAALREYKYSLDGGGTWSTATIIDNGDGSLGIALSGLTPGTTYPTELKATNIIGRSASATLELFVSARSPQTIEVLGIHDVTLDGGPLVLPTETTDHLPLTYTAGPPEVCTVTANTVSVTGLGTCTVTADQAGDSTHMPATATGTFEVTMIEQLITIPGLDDTSLDNSPVLLPATTSGDLPLTYVAGPSSVCIVVGNVLTLVGEGTCTVTASQAGDSTHLPASTTSTFVVKPTMLVLTLHLNAGDDVGNSPIEVRGNGLKPNSGVRIELHSTPILLGTATTDANGDFVTTVFLPAVVPAGTHHVVVIGTAPDEQPATASAEFFVDWSGSFGEIQTTGGYTPLTATRILDTRLTGNALTAAVERQLVVPADLVPADATSLVLNLTVTGPSRSGFITVYPCGTARPLAAAINFTAGETKANLVDTLYDNSGALCLWSNVGTDVVVDLQGYHSNASAGRLVPRTAVRLVDTRPDNGVVAEQVLVVPVIGTGKAPIGTTTVALNIAVDGPQRSGFVTVYPCGTDRPWASNLNFVAGQTVSNEVLVRPGADGNVCVYATAATHIVVDLNATYDATGTGLFTALVPGRLVDTRLSTKLTAGQPVAWAVVGDNAAPAGTTAVSLNIAVTDPERDGYLTVYPCGSPIPWASNLNFAAGQTISNHVTATVGADGTVCVYASQNTNVVIDVEGIYLPGPT